MPEKQWVKGKLATVGDTPLVSYTVNPDLFFPETGHYEVVKDSITQIIERYDLKRCDVVSIGPGDAQQEYWFHKNECDLTLVDIGAIAESW